MIGLRERLRNLAAAVGWGFLLLPLAVVLLSVVLSPASNLTVRTGLAGFLILAIARPDAALLVTTAMVGFAIILAHLAGVPTLRVTEVFVVASLAGCCIRALPDGSLFRRALTRRISVPLVLFATVAIASTLIWQRVYQFETGYASGYVETLRLFAVRDYFVQPGDFWVIVSTAVLLEGLALYVAAAALCQLDGTFFVRAVRMLTLGGAGLAALSAVRLADILLRNPGAIAAMRATSAGMRISPQIGDYIAAGSYFALCWLAALGLALASSRRRLLWVAAGLPLVAALYLTGSRSVIAAALAGVVMLVLLVVRQKAVAARGVVIFASLLVVVMIMSYPWLTGRDVAGELARLSLTVRIELLRAGLRVIETEPLFGVGIDRFYLVAGSFASPELRALWNSRMNPHNDFLRFGGELGLVGLGVFLWILIAAGRRIWSALRHNRDVRLAGLAAGLVAFLVTSLVSNPLMVREVSYVFWIALGLAVGQSARLQASAGAAPGAVEAASLAGNGRLARWRWPIAALLGGLVLLSIPFRARQALAGLDVRLVTYGLFEWSRDPDGTLCRWSGPRATLFVDARARVVEIPLSGTLPSGAPQQVEVRVDGRLADRVSVGREWQLLRTVLPPAPATGPRRIDLAVFPSWVPADVMPANQDRRVLGVKVGEIKVLTPTEGR